MTNRFIAELAFVVFTLFVCVYVLIVTEPKVVKIDCRFAEISPDIPVDLKEQCRFLRGKW